MRDPDSRKYKTLDHERFEANSQSQLTFEGRSSSVEEGSCTNAGTNLEKEIIERKASIMKRFLRVVDDLKGLKTIQERPNKEFDHKLLSLLDAFYEIMGACTTN